MVHQSSDVHLHKIAPALSVNIFSCVNARKFTNDFTSKANALAFEIPACELVLKSSAS
jgi:hypothetical protein